MDDKEKPEEYEFGEYTLRVDDRIMIIHGKTRDPMGPARFKGVYEVEGFDPDELTIPVFRMESDDTEILGCECWWVPWDIHEDAVAQVKREREEQQA